MVGLARNLIHFLLLRSGRRRLLVVPDKNRVQGSGPSEGAVDVDEVFDLGEMGNPGLDMAVEVGVHDDPANTIGESAFVVARDSVSGEMVVEHCSPFPNEVGGTGNVATSSFREATTSKTSLSVNHCESMKNCLESLRIFEEIFEWAVG